MHPGFRSLLAALTAAAAASALLAAPAGGQSAAVAAPPSADSVAAAAAYLDGVLDFIQQNSIHRQLVDWPRERAAAHELARGATTTVATYPAIRRVLASLDDRHSRFFPPAEAAALVREGRTRSFGLRILYPEGTVVQVYAAGPAERAGLRVGDSVTAVNGKAIASDARGVLVALSGDTVRLSVGQAGARGIHDVTLAAGPVEMNIAPGSRRLPGRVGYLDLPEHLGPGEVRGHGRYADLGQAAIRAADTPAACGWIVDLRRNGGGNLWPMLAALGPVLGEGSAGAFVKPESTQPWGYRNGRAEVSGTAVASVAEPYRPQRDSLPVAVLTSRVTGSSGEAVAVAFRGRVNSRSFGEPTAGVPTVNTSRQLPDSALLVLTTGLDADRTGRQYSGRIAPDESVALDWSRHGEVGDPVIDAAWRWLRRQPACSAGEPH